MKNLFISLILSLGFGTAFAGNTQTYECKHGTGSLAGRKLEINYLSETKKVPCDVVYTSGGISKTAWHANNEVGYCEKSAQTFLEKLKTEGWQCEETAAASKPVESAPSAPTEHVPAEPASSPAPEETPAHPAQ